MKTLYIAVAAISVLASLLMSGCGGAPSGQTVIGSGKYGVEPPVTLTAVGQAPGGGQPKLAFHDMSLHIQFGDQCGPGVRVVMTDEQGVTRSLEGEWSRHGDQMDCVNMAGDATDGWGSLVGTFSSRRVHFEGTLSISRANGQQYVMPVRADVTGLPPDF
ncbi:MAG: hypothetical protein WCP21_19110 [Armatimonadota bacterium]